MMMISSSMGCTMVHVSGRNRTFCRSCSRYDTPVWKHCKCPSKAYMSMGTKWSPVPGVSGCYIYAPDCRASRLLVGCRHREFETPGLALEPELAGIALHAGLLQHECSAAADGIVRCCDHPREDVDGVSTLGAKHQHGTSTARIQFLDGVCAGGKRHSRYRYAGGQRDLDRPHACGSR